MHDLARTMHILYMFDKKTECLDYALKHFPQGNDHLDVWVLMDKDGNKSAVEVVNCDRHVAVINMQQQDSGVLLEVPYQNDHLNLLSYFISTQEYSKGAKRYIELLESIVTGLADPAVKELVTKRLAEKV